MVSSIKIYRKRSETNKGSKFDVTFFVVKNESPKLSSKGRPLPKVLCPLFVTGSERIQHRRVEN